MMLETIEIQNQVYSQRNPQETPLYKIIEEHFWEFKEVYEERFQEKYGYWRSCIDDAVVSFLECGIYDNGFAKVQCKTCDHQMIVSFSCKGRCFCPSCQEKRSVWWAEWLTDEVLYDTDHSQFVFTIPKILRGYFRRNHYLLSDLAKCAWFSIKEFLKIIYPNLSEAIPAAIITIQSFGNLSNWNPTFTA